MADIGVDGRIILKWIFKKYCEDVDWIHLTQIRDQQRALLSTIMYLLVP
jgi:hypothetical protein